MPITLTKAQIAEMITEKNGFTKNKSIEVVETLIEIIRNTLESGEDVLVSGFGKFCIKRIRAKPRSCEILLLREPTLSNQLMIGSTYSKR